MCVQCVWEGGVWLTETRIGVEVFSARYFAYTVISRIWYDLMGAIKIYQTSLSSSFGEHDFSYFLWSTDKRNVDHFFLEKLLLFIRRMIFGGKLCSKCF